jgi:hypothetical protein
MVAAFLLNVDLRALGDNLVILDRRDKPEAVTNELARLARKRPFALVIVETLAAFFDGKNISDPVEGGEFMRRLRPFTQIPGQPSVIVSAHPVKNASSDALIPYGSGAILNEVDGNLTLWKNDGVVCLHWQGKLRGLEFDPPQFRLEVTGSPDLLDVKNRQVQLPTMRPCAPEAVEEKRQTDANLDRALLLAMLADPAGSQTRWADAIGLRSKSSVNARLHKLSRAPHKFVEQVINQWRVTAKGRKAVSPEPPGVGKDRTDGVV